MKLFSFVFTLFIALNSYAYCDKPTFNIYFANGMFNSHRAAAKSYTALKNMYENQEFEGVSIKFDESFVAYNTNKTYLLNSMRWLGKNRQMLILNFGNICQIWMHLLNGSES